METTESYRQQLQATAYALGRDIRGKVSFWATAEATRKPFFNFLMKKYGASRYILTKRRILCNLTVSNWSIRRMKGGLRRPAKIGYQEVEGKGPDYGEKNSHGFPADYRLVLVADISQVYRDMEKQVMLFLEFYLAAAVISVCCFFPP